MLQEKQILHIKFASWAHLKDLGFGVEGTAYKNLWKQVSKEEKHPGRKLRWPANTKHNSGAAQLTRAPQSAIWFTESHVALYYCAMKD